MLRMVNQSTKDPNQKVLGPNWKGPYKVSQVAGLGVYRLAYLDEREVKRP